MSTNQITSHAQRVISPQKVHDPGRSPNQQPGSSKKPRSIDAASIIGWILQGGVIVSSVLIIIGILLLPLRPGGLSVHRVFAFPHTLGEVWAGLLVLRPQSFIVVGLLVLIATPVLRVAVSIVTFALEHDRRYAIITGIVLAILILSFLLGKGGA